MSLSDVLGVVFDPKFWIANEAVSHEWSQALDVVLESVIAGNTPIRVRTSHHVVIGNCAPIWISNYPYAYGSIEGGAGLPTRLVRKKLAAVIAAHDAARALSTESSITSAREAAQ